MKSLKEIEKFKQWAEAYSDIPQDARLGEWGPDTPRLINKNP